MTEHATQSWAQVVTATKTMIPASNTSDRLEFKWKLAKKGRFKLRGLTPATDDWTISHCLRDPKSCHSRECITRLDRELVAIKADNIALDLSFKARLSDFEKLRVEIKELCNAKDLFSAEMEVSRNALRAAIGKGKKSVVSKQSECECSSCQLAFYQKTNYAL